MAEYSLETINARASHDAAAFIEECEARYHEEVTYVAGEIAACSHKRPIVLVCGPSSSGKTTTTDRLGRALEKYGIHAEMISMDDYYRTVGTYVIPNDDENGVPDLESPDCMDLSLLGRHLTRLAAGEEIEVPRFDFTTRSILPEKHPLRLKQGEVALIEGIHAFNPVITGDLSNVSTTVFLSVASTVAPADGSRLEPYMLRFLRRAMRDSLFRNSPVEETLAQWNSVRRGERLYISPYRGRADYTIDTFLPYELNILLPRLQERLCLHKDKLEAADLAPLAAVLGKAAEIDYAGLIPEDSLMHEFIG